MAGHDMPFIDPVTVGRLFELADGHDAATPLWPNGYVEPLHAVYRARTAADTALALIGWGETRLRMILRSLPDVAYLPVSEIAAVDPVLSTLFDVDTEEDLAKAEEMLMRGSA